MKASEGSAFADPLRALYNAHEAGTTVVLLFTISLFANGADLKLDLETHFRQACDSGKFMGAASVTAGGETIFSGACGLADAEWNVKNTIDTRFLLASITKEFTGAAVLLLHEEKKFEFTDPIGKCVPNLPESWQIGHDSPASDTHFGRSRLHSYGRLQTAESRSKAPDVSWRHSD